MKERPILFSGDMVKAILDGRKTQTRRPVKFGPVYDDEDDVEFCGMEDGSALFCESDYPEEGSVEFLCPYGRVGDHLWVKEKFQPVRFPGKPCVGFKYADGHSWLAQLGQNDSYAFPPGEGIPDNQWLEGFSYGWRPSIHMPRWVSRIRLEITNVRAERLQEISADDAIDEGYDSDEPMGCVLNFASSWDSIYKDKGFGWDKNPWLWVIEFRRI